MSDNPDKEKAWIEEGIIYINFSGALDFASVIRAEQKEKKLISDNKIDTIPVIAIFNDVDSANTKVELGGLSKIITAYNVIKHVSGIWLVGTKGNVRKSANLMNKFFMGGRMHLEDDLDKAKAEARELINETTSIIDQR